MSPLGLAVDAVLTWFRQVTALAVPDGPGHPSSPSGVKCSEIHWWKPVWVWVGWGKTVQITEFLWQDSVPVSYLNKSKLPVTTEPKIAQIKEMFVVQVCACSHFPSVFGCAVPVKSIFGVQINASALNFEVWGEMQTLWTAPELGALPRAGSKAGSCRSHLALQGNSALPALGCAAFTVAGSDTSLLPGAAAALGLCRRGGTPSHQAEAHIPLEILLPLFCGLAQWFFSDVVGSPFLLCDPWVQNSSEHFLLMVLGHPRNLGTGVFVPHHSRWKLRSWFVLLGFLWSLLLKKKMHLFSSQHPICIQMQVLTIVWTCCRCSGGLITPVKEKAAMRLA